MPSQEIPSAYKDRQVWKEGREEGKGWGVGRGLTHMAEEQHGPSLAHVNANEEGSQGQEESKCRAGVER